MIPTLLLHATNRHLFQMRFWRLISFFTAVLFRGLRYLTSDILKEYETVVKPRARECGKYPELPGSINRLLELRRIVQKSRGFKCKPRRSRPVFHVPESTVVIRGRHPGGRDRQEIYQGCACGRSARRRCVSRHLRQRVVRGTWASLGRGTRKRRK